MISFKHEDISDKKFIEKLFRSTREMELSITNWSDELKNNFCQMQLAAQMQHYKMQYPHANYDIILYKKKSCGRFYFAESETIIHVIDISILPEFQNKGIGTKIFTNIILKAKQKNIVVKLQVFKDNLQAKKLYMRLGFKTIGETQTHEEMEWKMDDFF